MLKNRKKGFTLIELLVVIAIIGILSSVVLASLNSARKKSRDAKRISEVKSLQLALELYNDSKGGYPSVLTALVPTYISILPTPPSGVTGVTNYAYAPIGAGCLSYHIGSTLEDANNRIFTNDADAAASSGTNQCPDEASGTAKTDFAGTDPVYDLVP